MKPILVRGIVKIEGTGGKILTDRDGNNLPAANQTLADSSFNDTALNFVPMHPSVKAFDLARIIISYIDTSVNADDLADVWFFRGSSATDTIQQRYYVTEVNAVTESPTNDLPTSITDVNPNIPVELVDVGRFYFLTNWTTAVLDCDAAGEHFYIEVLGYATTHTHQYNAY